MEHEKEVTSFEEIPKPLLETEENFIDAIKDVLALNNQNLIDNKIFENTINIINFLKDIDNKLYEEFNLNIKEVDKLIKCLKFIDTLNLFMNQASINTIAKLLYSINESIILIKSLSMDIIIFQIKYTEKSLIYYKKAFFKSLFFQNDQQISERFNEILDENNLYDIKTFKQIQNLFYVFSLKLDDKIKDLLTPKINYLKSIILPPKRNIFNCETNYSKQTKEGEFGNEKKYNKPMNVYDNQTSFYNINTNNSSENYNNYNNKSYNNNNNNNEFMSKSNNVHKTNLPYNTEFNEVGKYNNFNDNYSISTGNNYKYYNNYNNNDNTFYENNKTPVKNIYNNGYYGVDNSIYNDSLVSNKQHNQYNNQYNKQTNQYNNKISNFKSTDSSNKSNNLSKEKENINIENKESNVVKVITSGERNIINKNETINLDVENMFNKEKEKVELVKVDINHLFDTGIPTLNTTNSNNKNINTKVQNVDIDDHNYSIDSSNKSDIEEFEDLEDDELSDEEENEEDEFTSYIKQDIENRLNSELYSDTGTKNDKIIFGSEVKMPKVSIVPNEELEETKNDKNVLNTKVNNLKEPQSEYIPNININKAIVETINIEKSTPYIPISSKNKNKDIDKEKDIIKDKEKDVEILNNDDEKESKEANQVLFRGKDSSIHKEYFSLKLQEQSNPNIFANNLNLFENYVLNPMYQKININVYKKKIKYYLAFTKYKNLIYRTLNKTKMLKKVKPYGSYVNNFLTENGDIDICIVPKCKILDFAKYLEKVKEVIIEKDIGDYKLSHYNERYLLLKIIDKETQFIIDITVHTMLPILNSKLVKIYSQCDQRFHIMGIYLKHWAKINKIHGAADNFLSSYALLLMIIHFMQKVIEPKILPNLQKVDRKEKMYHYTQAGAKIQTNIFFEENKDKIKKEMERINEGRVNEESVVSLLVKFFEYYSYYFDNQLMKISISDEVEVLKTEMDNYAFSLVDPFDPTHNPGKSLIFGSIQFNKFVTAMKKEINYILTGEYIKRLDIMHK